LPSKKLKTAISEVVTRAQAVKVGNSMALGQGGSPGIEGKVEDFSKK